MQLAGDDGDAEVLLDGSYIPDLILYSVSGSAAEARSFLNNVKDSVESCRVALMIDSDRASEISSLMDVGPLIVLQKPVRKQDLANVITLISN